MVCRSGAAVKAVASDGHLGVEFKRDPTAPANFASQNRPRQRAAAFLASGHGWEKGKMTLGYVGMDVLQEFWCLIMAQVTSRKEQD